MREQLTSAVLVDRIKSGKPVADAVFSKGVSAPLLQFEEGPLKVLLGSALKTVRPPCQKARMWATLLADMNRWRRLLR
jgi:hypothetical protein